MCTTLVTAHQTLFLKNFDQIKIWLHQLNNIVLVGMASAGQNLQYWDWDQGEFDINTLQHALPLWLNFTPSWRVGLLITYRDLERQTLPGYRCLGPHTRNLQRICTQWGEEVWSNTGRNIEHACMVQRTGVQMEDVIWALKSLKLLNVLPSVSMVEEVCSTFVLWLLHDAWELDYLVPGHMHMTT